jgi:hypothetical protein
MRCCWMYSLCPSTAKLAPLARDHAATSIIVARSRTASNRAPVCDVSMFSPSFPRSTVVSRASRSGSGNGAGRNSTASRTLKIAVLTPMQSASVISTITVKPGLLRSWRTAYVASFQSAMPRLRHAGCHGNCSVYRGGSSLPVRFRDSGDAGRMLTIGMAQVATGCDAVANTLFQFLNVRKSSFGPA